MNNWKDIFDEQGIDYRINDDESVVVDSMLDLSGTNITSLPDRLTAKRWVNLRGTRIAQLPNNLDVKVWLNIIDTGITQIPENLKVGTEFYFDPEKINNVAFIDNCGQDKRTISVCRMNGQINVVSNCLSETLEDFYRSMDAIYSSTEGQEYKAGAMQCVNRFKQLFEPS